jgi:hypothetical protein
MATIEMKVQKFELYQSALNKVRENLTNAWQDTGNSIHNKNKKDEVMPFKTGEMQNRQTKTNIKEKSNNRIVVELVSNTRYALWVYFPESSNNDHGKPLDIHRAPGMNQLCDKGHKRYNKNAQGHWNDKWANETGRDYIIRTYKRNYKKRSK